MLGNLAGLRACERVRLSSAVIGIHHCWEVNGGSVWEGSTGSPALGQALCFMGSGAQGGVYGHVQCVQTCTGMHSMCTHLHGHTHTMFIPVWACTVCAHLHGHVHLVYIPAEVCPVCAHTCTGMSSSWDRPGCTIPLLIHSPCVTSSRAEAHLERSEEADVSFSELQTTLRCCESWEP